MAQRGRAAALPRLLWQTLWQTPCVRERVGLAGATGATILYRGKKTRADHGFAVHLG